MQGAARVAEIRLIANRGEIALRVIRTARRLGMRTIAVYSEADRAAMHVRAADVAVEIGPAPSTESYLRQDRLIEAAQAAGAECIHPGCGFLAENAGFAEACAAAGMVFVGPSPKLSASWGRRTRPSASPPRSAFPPFPAIPARRRMTRLSPREAAQIGYPVVLKAVAGGGGKGLKPVFDPRISTEAAAERAPRGARPRSATTG